MTTSSTKLAERYSLRMPTTRLLCTLVPAVALAASASPALAAIKAAPKPIHYANCAALNAVYPHGVARKGARDVVSGRTRPVTTFLINDAVYRLNTSSDRDKDGVACEKR